MANYNPYENMLHVLDKAAEVLGYKKNDYLSVILKAKWYIYLRCSFYFYL